MSNSHYSKGSLGRLPNCTQEVQLSTRDRQFGRTSECAHKMSNSPHGKGNLASLPTMHTR
ncbi:hypothetical protein PoB_003928000, partial [Plakobranchus ocellatus]